MALYLTTDHEELRDLLRTQIANHRSTDSGFDIPMISHVIKPNEDGLATFNFGIKAAALLQEKPIPFLILPRSSISATPFRLTNSIGLIDMGQRGELKAKVDVTLQEPIAIFGSHRLFQICRPDFMPWNSIQIVDELPPAPDTRGEGGFGSTG